MDLDAPAAQAPPTSAVMVAERSALTQHREPVSLTGQQPHRCDKHRTPSVGVEGVSGAPAQQNAGTTAGIAVDARQDRVGGVPSVYVDMDDTRDAGCTRAQPKCFGLPGMQDRRGPVCGLASRRRVGICPAARRRDRQQNGKRKSRHAAERQQLGHSRPLPARCERQIVEPGGCECPPRPRRQPPADTESRTRALRLVARSNPDPPGSWPIAHPWAASHV